VIPHGIDLDRFFPLPELANADFHSEGRVSAKQKVFGDFPDLPESPDNVKLCLHHAISGAREDQQIQSLVHQYGLEPRVYRNPLGDGVRTDRELNLLYNASDVGINTSMGEGWGLVSVEHSAAGAAQIVPDHTACAEIWKGHAELIPVARSYTPEFSVLEMGEVSAEGVAQALENLYRHPNRRRDLAKAAFHRAQDPACSWDAIAGKFAELFQRLLAGRH
jgi:D-inositol-3-phosphate glycosyltransferase